ncbi:MAG TPA: beta-N-acetylhexosaminidase [Bacilli bacterium]|jgi:hexosaminidase|nr:beta-N-acetylhexosaminidase [Bacilli bacterium]HPL55838.1 beta-N-acetylhexosaminidase [Bacilli bacterium]
MALAIIPQVNYSIVNKGNLFPYHEKNIIYTYNNSLEEEGYKIITSKEGIVVEYAKERGKFYGQKTLEQLFLIYPHEIPEMTIHDYPQYPHRGFMIDSCRHFFSISEIKKQIEIMALVKMNVFHWHLSDDQGWRIEIKKYPKLTTQGSFRKQTRGDGREVSGYYTQEQIKEIIEFCQERYIDVIPEIDMPGHFTAACSCYPELLCTKEKIDVAEHFGILPNIACVGRDFTYQFCCDVLDEVCDLFPSRYVHIGGDEALKLNWLTCPDCQAKMKSENLKTPEELETAFLNEIAKHIAKKGKKTICWNDGMSCETIDSKIIMQYWKDDKKHTSLAKNLVEKGYQTIISPFKHYYLDYNYGITPLKKTYNYQFPFHSQHIIGVEAPIWTEYISSISRLEYLAYPRLFAVAEKGWSNRDDYDSFLARLDVFKNKLDSLGINYAPLSEVNPFFLKRWFLKLSFYFNAVDKNIINSFRLLHKYKNRK